MMPLKAVAAAGIFATLSSAALAGDTGGSFFLTNAAGQSQGTAIALDGDGAASGLASSTAYSATPAATAAGWSAEAYSVQAAGASGAGAQTLTEGWVSLAATAVFSASAGQPRATSSSSAASLAYDGAFGSYSSEVYANAAIEETVYGFLISASAGSTTSATASGAGVTTSSDSLSTIFIKGNNVIVKSRAEASVGIAGSGGSSLVANTVAIAVARATQYGLTSIATVNGSVATASASTQSPAAGAKSMGAIPAQQTAHPGLGLVLPSPGNYLPDYGVTFALSPTFLTAFGLGWQAIYSSASQYDAPFAAALVSWAYSNRVQLYTSLQYQGYNLDSRYLAYGDTRVMTGMLIGLDRQEFLDGESLKSLEARPAAARGLGDPELTVSAGYSWLGLPDMKMVTVVGGPYFDQALGQEKNGGGDLNGWRTDARLANFAGASLPDGMLASFGVSGFFANYQGVARSHCMYSLTTDCAIVNIVDSSPNSENNTGPFGNLNVKVSRDVNYYGMAIDARLGDWAPGSFKDGAPAAMLSPFKVGLAIRELSEVSDLTSVDPLVSVPARYSENLDTFYYGAFLGIEHKAVLGGGWVAGFDGTAGLYGAATRFQGRYNGYAVSYSSGYVQDTGSLNINLDKAAFIGTLRLDLKKQFGWGTVGVFGLGEYLSYVPNILYNNNDQAGGPPWGIIGTQSGTRVESRDAFSLTTGLSVSVPVN